MVLILFCFFTFLSLWLLLRNFSFLSSFNMLLGSFFLYNFLGFADYLRGDYMLRYIGDQVVIRYREDQLIFELILLNTFVIGMLLATFVIKNKLTVNDGTSIAMVPPPYKPAVISAWVLMAAGIALYAAFIHITYGGLKGMLHIDRYALYQKKRGMGSLLMGLYIFYTGALIRLFYYVLYKKQVAQKFPVITIILSLFILLIQFRNGDRSSMLFFLLPLGILALYKRPKLNVYVVLVLPVLLVVMQLISVPRKMRLDNFKGSVPGYIAQNPQSISVFQNGEFKAPGLVDRKVCENINLVHLRFGGTYIDALLSMPPSWMVPKRPMLPAEWYMDNFFPEERSIGQGFGFSIITESILNFYYAGPLLFGFLLGLLMLYADKRLQKASFYQFAVFCVLLYYVFLIPRSGIAGLIKPVITIAILSRLCIAAVAYISSRGKRGAMPK